MKEIKLNQWKKNRPGLVALVDDEDFESLNQYKWHAHKNKKSGYYAVRATPNGAIKMHRQILGLTDPKIFGEHGDRNGLNNQRNNLRIATNAQNCANTKANKNGTKSGYKGVNNYKGKWIAKIGVHGSRLYLGSFDSKIKAAEAYNTAALLFFGKFARLNKTA